jgi:uncharacterized protein YeaO (DUF488 family)
MVTKLSSTARNVLFQPLNHHPFLLINFAKAERMIKIKRVYEAFSRDDGFRILIDRLWPRGISKEKGKIDLWLKEIGPSDKLRKWYAHDPEKWVEFKKRYFKELAPHEELVNLIIKKAKQGDVSLLFSSKEERLNNAVALKEYIEKIK